METYIRNGKKHCPAERSEERKCEEIKKPADTNISEEGEGEGAPGTEAEIPLQPVERSMVEQVFPCSPLRGPCQTHVAAHEGPYATYGYTLKELQPMECSYRSRLQAGLRACERDLHMNRGKV